MARRALGSRAVGITIPGADAMARSLRRAENAERAAHRRALRNTAKWAGRQSARGLAKAHRIPLRAITRSGSGRAGRKGRMRWTISDDEAQVWIGTYPVKAYYLGKVSQNTRGARAGRHSFPGAFVATMPNGKLGIWERQGRSRLPIVEQQIEMDEADSVRRDVEGRLPARYEELLRQARRFERLRRRR